MQRRQRRAAGALALMMLAAGCAPGVVPDAPAAADLAGELRASRGAPPADKPGVCWAADTTPAVIETVTEQVATPEQRDAQGRVIAPASYHTVTRQRMLADRRAVHFRTPCPEQMTVAFVASLQRALKARGHYRAPVSGAMDAATREAIRRFQEPLGLDSPVISLRGAKALGLVTTDLDELG